ncbi:unnamed protein product [Cylicocyclus nassatus]|uniref:Bestrophin homolog n=1 Tax=Cylicocyclus nassatus TaxID=53992 RepID=A0AA36H3J3_CYLNA|nr:unnamed protein product [Cylicocyclus nassatus]
MTVNYHRMFSSTDGKLFAFARILFRWKASIWKAVYVQLLIFLAVAGTISVVYRAVFDRQQQMLFDSFAIKLQHYVRVIPLELVLGFFCTQVFNRWTIQYHNIGFIDNVGLMTALYVRGRDEKGRLYRRNIIRYCELVQVGRDVSMRVRRRFPTMDTIVAAGFLMPHEKELLEKLETPNTPNYWIPANWALEMTYQAWKDGHIDSDYYKSILEKTIMKWRTDLQWVSNHDWVPLPLMYPQVVCLTVHLYFVFCVLYRQSTVEAKGGDLDVCIPIMTILQFILYMGWMKVIEAALNPFGEDDDDFETNELIDRNITMGMMMVDQGYNNPPDLRPDPFWDDAQQPLYSEETSQLRVNRPRGSICGIRLPSEVTVVRMMPHFASVRNRLLEKRATHVKVKEEEREPTKTIHWIFTVYAKILHLCTSLVQLLMPWRYRKRHRVSKRSSTDSISAHKENSTLAFPASYQSFKDNQEDRV